MTERPPDPQNAQSPAVKTREGAAGKSGFLVQAVAVAGVVVLTVIVTLWISRDSDQPGIEVLIPEPAPVTFQVSGEVVRPGVYSLDGDPRIDDAITAAGGLTSNADDSRINLALRVRDGAKVVIPAMGSIAIDTGDAGGLSGDSIGVDAAGSDGDRGGGIVSGTDPATGLIDLNTASKDQLISLPGIGDVRADSIIEWRTNNLISSVNDLLAISGIGTKTINSIRGLVTQP